MEVPRASPVGLHGSCAVSQNRLSKAFLLDLGQSAVAALKFFSAPPVAGSNRA
jgi:hypothetical protein